MEASQDLDWSELVRQAITQELIRKRDRQLDEADIALDEKRLDDVSSLISALTWPDDLAFRGLRAREQDLRMRLFISCTVESLAPVEKSSFVPVAILSAPVISTA